MYAQRKALTVFADVARKQGKGKGKKTPSKTKGKGKGRGKAAGQSALSDVAGASAGDGDTGVIPLANPSPSQKALLFSLLNALSITFQNQVRRCKAFLSFLRAIERSERVSE